MGQRARLFTLAVELGAADIAQTGAAAEQAHRCLAMTQELREHADHEDTYIHQLLRERAPEAADALEAEHIRLDSAFAALDDRARALPGISADALPEAQHALYLALGEVISAYLAHLHLEETVAMPALWQFAGEKELAAVMTAFHASRPPEEALTDLHRMLPALPPAPREAIVREVVENAPWPADQTLATVSANLSPEQRNRLRHDLGMTPA
ncbi:hemerythrin domain-containing protein [Streptomyces sp. NBC_00443]|uniref:hemerythrin domain-containing protein n=1 Tax=Streptomyces sp. NBC_00443 TaxID=2975743 RepID=UPI002E24F5A6